jgi:hypothetical protein
VTLNSKSAPPTIQKCEDLNINCNCICCFVWMGKLSVRKEEHGLRMFENRMLRRIFDIRGMK